MTSTIRSFFFLLVAASVSFGVAGCRKKVDADKTLECAQNQPYKSEDDCKKCCGGAHKLKDTVCLCYK